MNQYLQKRNEDRLANQAPEVQAAAKALANSMKSIDQYLYWALDPAEKDGGAYYTQTLLDHAHQLIDLAHDFRAAVKANPPPSDDDAV